MNPLNVEGESAIGGLISGGLGGAVAGENIAWACIYNNKEDAKSHKIEYGLKTISRL